jgi:thiosulfate/3-mercaptopyruvate sulfurtransferase
VESLLNAAGIDLSKEIIAYGRMGDPVAHWVLIAVRQFGGRNGKVFYGGLDEWQAAGEPVSTEAARLAPVEQRLTLDPSVQVGLAEVRSKVGNPGVQFVDTRSPAEFVGDDIRALRGGHIPGARNVPYEQNWLDPGSAAKLSKGEVKTRDGMALKPPRQIEALYAALDPGKETIVYCQSGMRAALTATVLRDLGFGNVRVFEDSWLGYGNDLSARAEDVQFVNIGELKTRIRSLEGAVEDLTAEIRTLKASKP